MKKNILLQTAASSILAAALVSGPSMAHADKEGFEKCQGIVKAGKNDCNANGHVCAGKAKVDNDPNEWIFVPEGTCNKIVGGTVKPKAKKDQSS